jgi:hypothetical protein
MALPGRDGKAGSPIEQESTRRTGYRERCLYPAELDAWKDASSGLGEPYGAACADALGRTGSSRQIFIRQPQPVGLP